MSTRPAEAMAAPRPAPRHPVLELLARYRAVFAAAWAHRHELAGPQRLGDEAAFLPAALSLQETPVHPAPRRLAGAIIALFVIALTWSIVGQVDIVAVAPGKIIVNERTKVVQPLERSVVQRILVRDGDHVQAGQPLVELDPTNADTILLGAGITTTGVTLTRWGDSLYIAINGTSDRLHVDNYFYQDGTSRYAVENLKFADGTVWDYATTKGKLSPAAPVAGQTLYGTSVGESLTGTVGVDAIYGEGGNDTLDGGAGNDWLDGGTGDDILKGMRGDDTMIGGAGNDTLYDSYRDGGADLFRPGTGNDQMVSYTDGQVDRFLMEQATGGFGQDSINYFERGIDQIEFHGYTAAQMSLTTSGFSSVFAFADGSSLTVDQVGLTAGHDFIFT